MYQSNKFKTLIKSFCIISLMSSVALAHADNGSSGRYVTKLRGQAVTPINTKKISSTRMNINFYDTGSTHAVTEKTTYGNKAGIEFAGGYFLSDNIAVEASVGLVYYKMRTAGTGPQLYFDASNNAYTLDAQPFAQHTKVFIAPITGMIQYHIAPYGKLNPYVGVGYHYGITGGSSGTTFNNTYGMVMQIGVSSWLDNDFGVEIDFKKYKMASKLTYKTYSTLSNLYSDYNNVPMVSRIQLDPAILSLGLVYRL